VSLSRAEPAAEASRKARLAFWINAYNALTARGILRDYVAIAGHSHSPQTLSAAFGMHLVYGKTGDMRTVDWANFK
jgi:hypothetical protein